MLFLHCDAGGIDVCKSRASQRLMAMIRDNLLSVFGDFLAVFAKTESNSTEINGAKASSLTLLLSLVSI